MTAQQTKSLLQCHPYSLRNPRFGICSSMRFSRLAASFAPGENPRLVCVPVGDRNSAGVPGTGALHRRTTRLPLNPQWREQPPDGLGTDRPLHATPVNRNGIDETKRNDRGGCRPGRASGSCGRCRPCTVDRFRGFLVRFRSQRVTLFRLQSVRARHWEGWSLEFRDFVLVVPVRCPLRWLRPVVSQARPDPARQFHRFAPLEVAVPVEEFKTVVVVPFMLQYEDATELIIGPRRMRWDLRSCCCRHSCGCGHCCPTPSIAVGGGNRGRVVMIITVERSDRRSGSPGGCRIASVDPIGGKQIMGVVDGSRRRLRPFSLGPPRL